VINLLEGRKTGRQLVPARIGTHTLTHMNKHTQICTHAHAHTHTHTHTHTHARTNRCEPETVIHVSVTILIITISKRL